MCVGVCAISPDTLFPFTYVNGISHHLLTHSLTYSLTYSLSLKTRLTTRLDGRMGGRKEGKASIYQVKIRSKFNSFSLGIYTYIYTVGYGLVGYI